MLSVNPIARVVVNAVRSSASPASFDTSLLLIQDASFIAARRLATCDSSAAAISQLAIWGFSSGTEDLLRRLIAEVTERSDRYVFSPLTPAVCALGTNAS